MSGSPRDHPSYVSTPARLAARLHLMPAAERGSYDPVLFMMSSICVLQQAHKLRCATD